MQSITINSALSMGEKSLRPITKNYKNETLWIIQKVLNKDTAFIVLNKFCSININQHNLFIDLIKRRVNKEPLQHILESVSFYGYNLEIRKNIFIPRAETELLIDIVKKYIKPNSNILEIGTGSGCIPIVIELEKISNCIQSIDINNDAISLARINAEKFKCRKIEFICDNFFEFKPQRTYDFIISNPPYIPINEISNLDYEVTLYDPLNALTDYDNGLTFYKYFYHFGCKYLNSKGYMLFEFGGKEQVSEIKNIFNNEIYSYNVLEDLNNEPRFMLIQKL